MFCNAYAIPVFFNIIVLFNLNFCCILHINSKNKNKKTAFSLLLTKDVSWCIQ